MVALLPAEGRRLPVVPPVVPLLAVAACGVPLLVAGLAEVSAPSRAEGLRATGAAAALAGYVGLTLTVGVLAFALLLHRGALARPRVQTAVITGWAFGVTGAITSTLVAAANTTGMRISALGPNDFGTAASDPEFRARAAAVAMWVLSGIVLLALRGSTLTRPTWLVASSLLAFGLVRLTSVTADRPLADPTTLSSLVHLGAMTLWLGGLVTLLLELRRMSHRDLRRVLPRFSRVAFAAVATVVATGIVLTIAYVDRPADLLGSDYGRLVLAKATLLVLILVAARRSQRWVSHRLGAGPLSTSDGAVRTLLCAVAVEITLAVAVLGVAAALVTAPGG